MKVAAVGVVRADGDAEGGRETCRHIKVNKNNTIINSLTNYHEANVSRLAPGGLPGLLSLPQRHHPSRYCLLLPLYFTGRRFKSGGF